MLEVVLALALLVCGALLGWLASQKVGQGRIRSAQQVAEQTIARARQEAGDLAKTAILEARDEWRRERIPLEKELENGRRALREAEAKLLEREQEQDRQVDQIESRERALIRAEQEQEQREAQIAAAQTRVGELVRQQAERLEELAGLTQAEARQLLLGQLEESARQLAARKVREIKDQAISTASLRAKEIVATAIQRFAGKLAVESTVSVVPLASDDMKGRIIGRDGRNIRSFEMITGVEVIVDDTPGMVMLSTFDPLRRQIATTTLQRLIQDGRIHPGRIEEVYAKASQDIEELIRESGSQAAFDLGIHDLAEPLLEALGQLRFCTSYGQNLLEHSKEVGILAGMMAEELELDASLARRAGLLHDIARAFGYDAGADPAQASAALARKCGESPEVIQVIETHNQNLPSRSIVAVLVEAANDISLCRPGARKEKVEEYIRRLRDIEEVARAHVGVRQAFALQNGKEVHVMVDSEVVDDTYADQLAEEIAEKLEKQLDHPGQIRVCVIREVRAVHYAR
ncbi:MAG: ribonuclease Y [Candidatus Latescibacterota bacterium]